LILLDSRVRGNNENGLFLTFYEFVNFEFQTSLNRFLRDYSKYFKRNIKSQTANPARREWIRLFLQFININNMLHIIPMIVQSSFDRMEVFLKNRKDLMFIFS